MSTDPSTTDEEAIPIYVGIDAPPGCPIATATAETDSVATNIGICERSIPTGEVVGEFTLASDDKPGPEFERIRSGTRGSVYRFRQSEHHQCPCELIERSGTPVTNVSADSGTLNLTFHADPHDAQEVLRRLATTFDSVNVRQPQVDPTEEMYTMVDLSNLTARQFEVLERAFEMGYFDFPKGANAGDVAEDLDIARSTFSEHLAAAQRKLFTPIFEA